MSRGIIILAVSLLFVSCGDEAKVLEGPPQPEAADEAQQDLDERDEPGDVDREEPDQDVHDQGGSGGKVEGGGAGGSGTADRADGGKKGESADRDAGAPMNAGEK